MVVRLLIGARDYLLRTYLTISTSYLKVIQFSFSPSGRVNSIPKLVDTIDNEGCWG